LWYHILHRVTGRRIFKMNNKNNGLIFLGILALVGVAIYFATRTKEPEKRSSTMQNFVPVPTKTPDKTFYENDEKWHIEWSEDGLPTDITVTRLAKRS
jgi:hypothetical protein